MSNEIFTETFTDLFDDKNQQITFTYYKAYNYPLREHVRLLESDNFNNYINIFYFFRYLVYKDLNKNNIPYKPLFFKLVEGSTSKVEIVKNIHNLSFDEFHSAVACVELKVEFVEKINERYYLGYQSVSYKEPPYILQFPPRFCRKDYTKKAYDYFCELFPAPKPETIPPKNFVLTSNI